MWHEYRHPPIWPVDFCQFPLRTFSGSSRHSSNPTPHLGLPCLAWHEWQHQELNSNLPPMPVSKSAATHIHPTRYVCNTFWSNHRWSIRPSCGYDYPLTSVSCWREALQMPDITAVALTFVSGYWSWPSVCISAVEVTNTAFGMKTTLENSVPPLC